MGNPAKARADNENQRRLNALADIRRKMTQLTGDLSIVRIITNEDELSLFLNSDI